MSVLMLADLSSWPEAMPVLTPPYRFKRIGLEAGPLSQWLFSALAEAELPVVCVETRHMQSIFDLPLHPVSGNTPRYCPVGQTTITAECLSLFYSFLRDHPALLI